MCIRNGLPSYKPIIVTNVSELDKRIVLTFSSEQDANTHKYPVTNISLTYLVIIIH